jgi:hypothetical protein
VDDLDGLLEDLLEVVSAGRGERYPLRPALDAHFRDERRKVREDTPEVGPKDGSYLVIRFVQQTAA